MRKLVLGLLAAVAAFPAVADAQVKVRGYYRSDGTYVQPHYRSSPNSSVWDNWSTRGNVNPYTGQVGTRDPYGSYGYTPRYNPPATNYYNNPNSYFSTPYRSPYSTPRTPCFFNCPQ